MTTNEVAKQLGVSLGQLQWWDEKKLVTVRKEKHRRIYTDKDFKRVRIVAELRRKGMSTQQARRAIDRIQRATTPSYALVWGYGREVRCFRHADQAISLAVQISGPVVILEVR